jgi:hypothetical protein
MAAAMAAIATIIVISAAIVRENDRELLDQILRMDPTVGVKAASFWCFFFVVILVTTLLRRR